ncbi:6-phosphogluconolactonase [Actinomyces slackii]|uniref:6-phosphogluconolactonase n=1 Tax=Actinomyces slackii TaxID=52774 RepID=A0A3S4WL24_9ACTO|nr:6-phosphogluconolactonase [Actinomyces slackii]VEG75230.1 6-phosphogluconolactonase [Actinomyces slackii]
MTTSPADAPSTPPARAGLPSPEEARARIERAAAALEAPSLEVLASLDKAARAAAAQTARLLDEAVAERGLAHLALTGGSGGEALAEHLGRELGALEEPVRQAIHLWFGDERFVEAGDAQRNDLLVAPLVSAGIPEGQVHRLADPEAVADLDEATALMSQDLRANGLGAGAFDVIHLGLGPDAHVCSLFPDHPAALALGAPAVAVRESPKPPPQRVSLTFEVIHRARCVMVIAGGAGKAEAVASALGSPDALVPASCARGASTVWYLDKAAAKNVPN